MKKITLSVILSSLILSPVIASAQESQEQMVQESRQIIQKFAKNLKGELKAAMKAGGPVNAIKVCNEKAMDITLDASKTSGVELSRTSLRIRNPLNKPEAWEKAVLLDFDKRKNNGESPKKMEFSEIVNVNGKKQFRYMKAMGVAQPCLHCHGEKVLPAVTEKLSQLYPDDKATGYKKGDIRGAIVLTRELN